MPDKGICRERSTYFFIYIYNSILYVFKYINKAICMFPAYRNDSALQALLHLGRFFMQVWWSWWRSVRHEYIELLD